MHAARSWDGELSVPQRAASASLASSGTPFRTKAPPSTTTAPTQGSAIGASPLSPSKQASGGVALTATATSQPTDGSGRAAVTAREKQAAAEQAKAIQQQISKLEKQAAAEAGANQGGSVGAKRGGSAAPVSTTGARPSDISLRERQLVARQGEVAVAPALEKTLSGVPQRSASAGASQQQPQRRSVT